MLEFHMFQSLHYEVPTSKENNYNSKILDTISQSICVWHVDVFNTLCSTQISNLPLGQKNQFSLLLRLPALYSTDDEPSYELELCPTRKKSSHFSFFFIFSSDIMESWFNFPWKTVIFSDTSDISWPGTFILFFFPSDMEEIPLSGSVIRRI